SADGRPDRFPELAADLIRAKPDIILTRGTPAALAAKKAAGPVPVVMTTSSDPVGAGVVPNLARPGGNVTGLSPMVAERSGKRIELMRELVPRGSRVAALVSNPDLDGRQQMERAARSLGLQVDLIAARDVDMLRRGLESVAAEGAKGLLIIAEAVQLANRK